jgi:hypothetical protein
MKVAELDDGATPGPAVDTGLLERTLRRLESALRGSTTPDWHQVRAELTSALEQSSQRYMPDSLRLRLWHLALESPRPIKAGLGTAPTLEEPPPGEGPEQPEYMLEHIEEPALNDNILELAPVTPNPAGNELVFDTAEVASGQEPLSSQKESPTGWSSTSLEWHAPSEATTLPWASSRDLGTTSPEAQHEAGSTNVDDLPFDHSAIPVTASAMGDTYAVLEQDVLRTRRGLDVFERPTTRALLTRWLCAFCNEFGIPYMQGMNEIAAVFVYLHETCHAGDVSCPCYAMYRRFVERYVPLAVDAAEDPFGRLKQAFRLLTALLWFHDPELASLLERYQLSADMYATAWLVTIFARNLEMDAVLVLWDALLLAADPLLTIFVALVGLVSSRQSLLISSEASLPEQLLSIPFRSRQDVEAAWQWARKLATRTPTEALDRARVAIFAGSPPQTSPLAAMEACIEFAPTEVFARIRRGELDGFGTPLPVLVLDCRPADERQYGALPQAISVDLDELRDAVIHGWQPARVAVRDDPLAQRIVQQVLERIGPNQDGKCWISLVGSGPPTYFDIDELELDAKPLQYMLQHFGVHYVALVRRGFAACEALARSDGLSLLHYDPSMLAQVRQAKCARLVGARDQALIARRSAAPSDLDERLDEQLARVLGLRPASGAALTSSWSLATLRWLETDHGFVAKDSPLALSSPSLLRRLALYPCLKLQRKSNTFVRRCLGISKRRLLVLAPDRGRNTTFLVKSSRPLVLLKRILFRKETRELVVFEFRNANTPAIEKRITCHLADGLNECIERIRSHLKLIRTETRLQRRVAGDGRHQQGTAP